MSLQIRKDWLAAPVSVYAMPVRKRRPSQAKPERLVRIVGHYGCYRIVEILSRGKPALRYVRDEQGEGKS